MGHVTITQDDGTTIKRDLASVIIYDTTHNQQPRELLAMEQTYRMLSALSDTEARRVVNWLCEMFPEVSASEPRR